MPKAHPWPPRATSKVPQPANMAIYSEDIFPWHLGGQNRRASTPFTLYAAAEIYIKNPNAQLESRYDFWLDADKTLVQLRWVEKSPWSEALKGEVVLSGTTTNTWLYEFSEMGKANTIVPPSKSERDPNYGH